VLFLIEMGMGNTIRRLYYNCLTRRFSSEKTEELDDDVQNEDKRVEGLSKDDLAIRVKDFRKVYLSGKGPCTPGKPMLAVEKLSFGVALGECFCLLGVNGAGKSTTFKSLTNEIEPTQGTIHVAGFDVQKNFRKARKMMGYCP